MHGFTEEAAGATRIAHVLVKSHCCRCAIVALGACLVLAVIAGALSGCPGGPGISNATCFACHDGRTAIDMRDIGKGAHRNLDCALCHGDGEAHIRSGGRGGVFITNPENLPFDESFQSCAQCHANTVNGYGMSAHARDERVSCFVCHNIHSATGMTVDLEDGDRFSNDEYVQLCGPCHETQTDQFVESTHFTMNAARCGNCHNLHHATMLRQPKETNLLCLQCHSSSQLGFTSDAIVDAHTGPMHPVDPAGSGASRCTGCHMPSLTAFEADGANSHTMFPVPPSVSIDAIESGVEPVPPNTCAGVAGCHDPNVAGSGQPHLPTELELNMSFQSIYDVIGEIPE